MRIGIIGSGNVGGPLGRLWAQAGHEVMFASRNPGQLGPLVARAGANATSGTADQAMTFAEVILEAIPYFAALKLPAESLEGKILLSASNYFASRDGAIEMGDSTHTELVASRLPGTRVVKTFSMMGGAELAARADGESVPAYAVFVAGDDAGARATGEELVRDAGFTPVTTGPLETSRVFQSGGPLFNVRMSAEEAHAALAL